MELFVCSIKKSVRRATWQIKDAGSHELVPMHGLQVLFDRWVADLGGDPQDVRTPWDLVYGPKAFEGAREWTLGGALDHDTLAVVVPDAPGGGTQSGWIPSVLLSVFDTPPARLWVRLEASTTDRPVFLSRYLPI